MRRREGHEDAEHHRSNVVTAALAVVVAVTVAVVAAGCATAPPVELIRARAAYDRASAGPAAQLAPADLLKARLALDQAERALSRERNLDRTVDFAYVAERTAQIAEAHADTAVTEKATSKATRDLGDKQGELAQRAAGTLTATRAELAEAQRKEAEQAQEVGLERTAREAAEQKAEVSDREGPAGERRPLQVVGQGRRARHGDNPLRRRSVSFQRDGPPARGVETSRRGGKRRGGPGRERRCRGPYRLEGLAIAQRRAVAASR